MDSNSGGLSPSERQRKTAAAIARKRVLEAYGDVGKNTNKQTQTGAKTQKISKEDWHKYHSRWQNYYQKYYGEYYAKAARDYIATQKLREQRKATDEKRLLGDNAALVAQVEPSQEENASDQQSTKLRKKFARLSEHIKDSQRRKRFVPLLIGVGVVIVLLFLQFNRLLFAPIAAYVSPGNNEATSITPIESTAVQSVSPEPKLIIPKLNINVPVAFGISNDNATVMDAMNKGVAQFSIPGASAIPGENGNLVITGHSAGDLYSDNQYKFIFSGLERLTAGDTIYINYQSKRYTYSVTKLDTVEPTNVAALTQTTGKPQLILVTCTPLGTSRYRLLVYADQINPAPDSQTPSANTNTNNQPSTTNNSMPANEPTFFESIWNFLTGKN